MRLGGNIPPMCGRLSSIAVVATLLVAGATTAGGQTRAASDVEAMIVRGERLVTANRLDEAASIANEALARRPESARAHYLLGVVHERRQQLDAAAAEYRAAIARAPKLAEAHDRLGFVLGTQGRTDEAIAEFERAIAIRPSFFDAQYHLGATLWWTKQLDRARVALGRAVRLRPAHAEARYYLAVAERQSGDLTAAIRDLRGSTTGSLTIGKFFSNIVHAFSRTTRRFPSNPRTAYQQLCARGHRSQARALAARAPSARVVSSASSHAFANQPFRGHRFHAGPAIRTEPILHQRADATLGINRIIHQPEHEPEQANNLEQRCADDRGDQ